MKNPGLLQLLQLSALLAAVSASRSTAAETNSSATEALPRVLLIGDSICGGYEKKVKQLLAGRAEVVKNAGNAEHTGTGLKKLDEWLGEGKWDVIHFNWGLWDIAYRNPESKNFGRLDKVAGKLTTPLPDYEQNLRTLVARLKRTGAKLIWASITPVPDGEPGRIQGDEVKYNAVAAKIMAGNGVAIDDLYTLAIPQLTKLQQPNNVHFTAAGYNLLAGQVAKSILAALPGRKTAAQRSKPNIVFFLAGELCHVRTDLPGEIHAQGDRQFKLEPITPGAYKFDLKQGEEVLLYAGTGGPSLPGQPSFPPSQPNQ